MFGKNVPEELTTYGPFQVGCKVNSTFGPAWNKVGVITKMVDPDPQCYSFLDEINIYVSFDGAEPIIVPEDYLERIE